MDDARPDRRVEEERHPDAVEEVARVARRRAADEVVREAAPPSGPPPGGRRWRGRRRRTRPGSAGPPLRRAWSVQGRGGAPSPVTSVTSGAANLGGGGRRRDVYGRGEVDAHADAGGDGRSSRRAGSKRQRHAASIVACVNGASPRTTRASETCPSASTTSSTTTVAAPVARAGYGTTPASIARGGVSVRRSATALVAAGSARALPAVVERTARTAATARGRVFECGPIGATNGLLSRPFPDDEHPTCSPRPPPNAKSGAP